MTNSVALTLNEFKTINDPYYIFVFQNIMTKEEKTFYSENLSVNKDSFDLFDIVENSTEDLLNGVVSLDAGQWYYTAWESPIISLTSSNFISVVETGRVLVVGTSSTPSYDGEDEIIPSYNG